MNGNFSNFRYQMKVIRALLGIILGIVIAAIVSLFIFSMNDETRAHGVVEGLHNYDLKSSVRSRIKAIHFHDGDAVKAGTVMLELDPSELIEEIATLQNTIRSMEAELSVKQAELELLKHDPLPAEYRHTRIALDESRLRLATSKVELDAYRELRDRGAIAELDFRRREMEAQRNQMELSKLEDDYAKLTGGLAEKILRKAEAELALFQVRLEGKKQELALARKRIAEYRFTAPEDGVISYIPTKCGAYVDAGQSIIQFAAGDGKKFVAYVDEVEVYKVEPGQPVRIASSQYSIYEYGYFPGTVLYISELPLERNGKFYYPVWIRIENEPKPLRLGSSGEARINTGRDLIIRTLMGENKRR